MKNRLILLLILFISASGLAADEQVPYTMPNTTVVPLNNSASEEQYELYVKLPEGYEEKRGQAYPVIYFTDAVWHIDILSAATAFLMEEVILVGISWRKDISEDTLNNVGAHASRYSDYSLQQSSNPKDQAKYQYGQAEQHLRFIREDVITYVEKNYRIKPNSRTYFGYSLGGLFGAYILQSQPDTFSHYILGSPSLWRDIPYLSKINTPSTSKPENTATQVFVSNGTEEEELGTHINNFVTMLQRKKESTLSIHYELIDGNHGTAFPLTGVSSITWLSRLHKEGNQR